MAKTIVGLFDSPTEAQAAVDELSRSGIPRDRISVVARNPSETSTTTESGQRTEAGTGAGIGAATGAVVGGVAGAAGWLAALGLAAIPGVGPLLAAGPILAALTGAGLGAAAGGLTGALIGMGIPEEDAEVYEEGVRRGGTLVTAVVDDTVADRAVDIMTRHGAIDTDRRAAEWHAAGWQSKYKRDYTTTTGTTAASSAGRNVRETTRTGEHRMPEVEEQINIGKRRVQSGGVRVYTRATEQPVEQDVNLRNETVHVERRPADRPATEADMRAFKEGAIEVTETREEPVVNKETRVTGEVVVKKDVEDRKETVRDTVRKTDVQVERVDERRESGGTRKTGTPPKATTDRDTPASGV